MFGYLPCLPVVHLFNLIETIAAGIYSQPSCMCPTTYKIPTLLSGPRSHCCLQLHAHVKRPLKLPRPRCEIFCVCVCVSLCVFAFVCHGLWGRMRPEFVAQFDVGMLVRLCCGLCASAVVCVPLLWSMCLCCGLCASFAWCQYNSGNCITRNGSEELCQVYILAFYTYASASVCVLT